MSVLNIPPIRPNNNIGRSIRPINNNLRGSTPINNKPKSAFDSMDINRIGQGRLMTEGSYHKQFGVKQYSGLKGQLMKMKMAGRHSITKNLSMGNIKQIHNLIADRIKNKTVGSQTYISRRDKNAIMKEARELVKTKGSKFTWEDRKDLKKTVDTLQKQYKDKILHRDNSIDNPSLATELPSSSSNKSVIGMQPSPLQKNINLAEGNGLPPKISGNNKLSAQSPDTTHFNDQ